MDANLIQSRKTRKVTAEIGGNSGSHNQTAASYGNIGTVLGITGLTYKEIVSLSIVNTILTPASILVPSLYNNTLYIAATQSCTRSSTMTVVAEIYDYDYTQ